jgi:hypothetical protein
MRLPIPYSADRDRVERILLEAARRHAVKTEELTPEAAEELKRRYFIGDLGTQPRVYFRITDNWLEMAVRFVVHDRGIRDVKDAMARDILRGLDGAGVGLASGTYDIVGLPPVRVVMEPGAKLAAPAGNGTG